MKRKRVALFLAAVLAALLLPGCEKAEKKPVTIWHASDLHYLSPTLIEDRAYFISVMERGDGKATHYTPEICRSFVETAVQEKPDVVILSGDLTLNGSLESHRDLAQILAPLQEAGIRVLVLPGNHDIGRAGYRFTSETPEPVPAADAETFAQIYADYGYTDALSRDAASLSYVADLGGGVRVLLIDVNSGSHGTVTPETLDWATKQLKAARRDGCTVIAVSHQNLYRHSPRFSFGYEINNCAELAALYEKYGVQLNLSGHLHIQHIAGEGRTADIAVSSLAVTPNQFGVLRLDADHRMQYETQPLTVLAEKDGVPLDFARYSAGLFDACTVAKTAPKLESMNLTEAESSAMLAVARQMNREYFGGKVLPPDPTGYALWTEHTDAFFSGYLDSIADEIGKDHTHWSSE